MAKEKENKGTKIYRISFHQPIKYRNKDNSLLPYQLVHELTAENGAEMYYVGGGDYTIDGEVLVHSANVKSSNYKPIKHPNNKK